MRGRGQKDALLGERILESVHQRVEARSESSQLVAWIGYRDSPSLRTSAQRFSGSGHITYRAQGTPGEPPPGERREEHRHRNDEQQRLVDLRERCIEPGPARSYAQRPARGEVRIEWRLDRDNAPDERLRARYRRRRGGRHEHLSVRADEVDHHVRRDDLGGDVRDGRLGREVLGHLGAEEAVHQVGRSRGAALEALLYGCAERDSEEQPGDQEEHENAGRVPDGQPEADAHRRSERSGSASL